MLSNNYLRVLSKYYLVLFRLPSFRRYIRTRVVTYIYIYLDYNTLYI
jgi:hypothetical protein